MGLTLPPPLNNVEKTDNLVLWDVPKVKNQRVIVSRSHSGHAYKLVEKFKPPGVVTPAGGSGYKVALSSYWNY